MKRLLLTAIVMGLLVATPGMASADVNTNNCNGSGSCSNDVANTNTTKIKIKVAPKINVNTRIRNTNTNTVRNTNTNTIRNTNTSYNTNKNLNVNVNKNTNQQQQYQGQKQGQSQGQGQNNYQRIDPSQTVTFDSPRPFLEAPGLTIAPEGSRPYNPEGWIHAPGLLLPTHLTFTQADSCRAGGISDSWDGNSLPGEAAEMTLWYAALKVGEPFPVRFTHYLGTAMVETDSDHAFVTAVCEAAYRAMEEGADMGIVSSKIRPRNKSWGVGLPASGAASSATSGLAGTAGMALGVSNAYVEGDLFIHITSFTRNVLVFPEETK